VKPYRFHRQADAEFTAAVEHYRAISETLGQRFYLTIDELLDEICSFLLWLLRATGSAVPSRATHFDFRFFSSSGIDRDGSKWPGGRGCGIFLNSFVHLIAIAAAIQWR